MSGQLAIGSHQTGVPTAAHLVRVGERGTGWLKVLDLARMGGVLAVSTSRLGRGTELLSSLRRSPASRCGARSGLGLSVLASSATRIPAWTTARTCIITCTSTYTFTLTCYYTCTYTCT